MQAWQQLYTPWQSRPVGRRGRHPDRVLLALAVFRLKGHIAGSITLALAIAVAIFAFHMPADMASPPPATASSTVSGRSPGSSSPRSSSTN